MKRFSLITKRPKCWHELTSGAVCSIALCSTAHAASPTAPSESPPIKATDHEGQKKVKIEWEGETGDHKLPWIILRANPSRECGLNPQLQELHECSPEECLGGAMLSRNLSPPKPTAHRARLLLLPAVLRCVQGCVGTHKCNPSRKGQLSSHHTISEG